MKLVKLAVLMAPLLALSATVQAYPSASGGMKAVIPKAKAKKQTKKDQKAAEMYQCPMKCAPAQDKPGRCPVCGMAMEKLPAAK
jgi:hypothetical protein